MSAEVSGSSTRFQRVKAGEMKRMEKWEEKREECIIKSGRDEKDGGRGGKEGRALARAPWSLFFEKK